MSERREAAGHVFVNDIAHPILSEFDSHHLQRVLRLRAGEIVTVSDGHGSWRACIYQGQMALQVVSSQIHIEKKTAPELTVAFALTKGDKPELVVQKLTELGIDHIVPFISQRCVVRWDETKSVKNHERLQTVARQASMQSRRVDIAQVHAVVPCLADVVATHCGSMALCEPGAGPLDSLISTLVVGPEGGFTFEELSLVGRHVALPGGILRAETAAITAGVLLSHQRSHPKI